MTDHLHEDILLEEEQNSIPEAAPQDIRTYLESISFAKVELPRGEELSAENTELFDSFLNSSIRMRGSTVPNAAQLRLAPADTLNHHFWVIRDGSLVKMPIGETSAASLFAALKEGKTLVIPRPCFPEINRNLSFSIPPEPQKVVHSPFLQQNKILGYNYDEPLVLNASWHEGILYFHIFDAEEAYRHRNDVLPQYLDLHWYDYVLDFFAKFFGCRREICAEWDNFQEKARLRSIEVHEDIQEAFQTGRTFINFERENDPLPFASKEELDAYVERKSEQEKSQRVVPSYFPSSFFSSKKNKNTEVQEWEPTTKRDDLISWFKNRYETNDLQLHTRGGSKIYPQFFSPQKKAAQKQLNQQIHKRFHQSAKEHLYHKDFRFSNSQDISLSAAFHAALAFSLVKCRQFVYHEQLKNPKALEKYSYTDEGLKAFLLGENNMNGLFIKLFNRKLQTPTHVDVKFNLAQGVGYMWMSLIKQEDMMSPWSLQLAGMATRLDEFLSQERNESSDTHKSLLREDVAPLLHYEYNYVPDYSVLKLDLSQVLNRLFSKDAKDIPSDYLPDNKKMILALKNIYTSISKAENCALWPDFGKKPLDQMDEETLNCVLSGQANYAFLRRLNGVAPENRAWFIEKNYDVMLQSTEKLNSYVKQNIRFYEEPAQALLDGRIIRDYIENRLPPKKKNIIAMDDSFEELIDTSSIAAEHKMNKKKEEKALTFEKDLVEVQQIDSFKKETAENTDKSKATLCSKSEAFPGKKEKGTIQNGDKPKINGK
ncbi:MAG: hypothetical protein Q4B50_00240 [Bacillota bacterium]|nr:hypothetical protein [Bacillota bacterium]